MNSKYLKTGILAVLLVVPVFVFLFLHFFGKNHFDLPYLFPKIDQYGEPIIEKGDTVYHQTSPFKLLNQKGEEFSSEKIDDKIIIVDFFFTRCGTICPTMTSSLARVQKNFENQKDVQLVSITVDPSYDSPEILKQYAEKNKINGEKWNLLTGSKKEIYELAIQGFKLPVADASVYDTSIKSVDEMFIHSEKILLIDKKKHIRGVYDGTNKEDVERLLVEIKVLLNTYKTN